MVTITEGVEFDTVVSFNLISIVDTFFYSE